MPDVRLKYKRRSTTIFIPGSWPEVSHDDAPRLLSWACTLPDQYALATVLQHYLPRRYYRALDDDSLTEFIHLLHWYKAGPSAEPHIRHIEYKKQTYHMPTARFANGVAMEWPLADEFYKLIIAHADDPDLVLTNMRLLAATLYREYDDSGQRAQLTGRADVSERAVIFEDLDHAYLLNALYYFAGCKIDLAQIYGHTIFHPVESEDEDEGGSEAYFGWWGIYMDIAEAGLFGDLDAVHQTNFHTICMYLSKKYLEAQDRKQQEMFNRPDHD